MWWLYALLSAFFAALTAILAKVGIKEVNTDLATAIRTSVILFITWGIAFFRGGTAGIATLSKQSLLALSLSASPPAYHGYFILKPCN
jgi:transporter family protein